MTKLILDLDSPVERVRLPIVATLFPMEHAFGQTRSLCFSLFPSFTLCSLRPIVRAKGYTPYFSAVIERTFGVRYHRDHVGRLLREAGWSRQEPIERATQRDEEAIKQWYDERWPALKKKPMRRSPPFSG